METRITISNEILQWVMHSIALPKLNESIKERLMDWIRGDKQPTFNQLEALSKATSIPLGYFFLNQPPNETCSILEYRTIDSKELQNPSRNLLDTARHMEDVQDWMRDYVTSELYEPNTFVGSIRVKDGMTHAVNTIRQLLKLNIDWYAQSDNADASFKKIRTAISNAGILVMLNGTVGGNTHRSLSVDEFRAFSLIDPIVPLIFINAADKSAGGRIFSLLHELVHIGVGEGSLLNTGEWASWSAVSPMETFCNKVVAEILVPESEFKRIWVNSDEDIEVRVSRIAAIFRCSHSVVVRRCLDSGYISAADYSKLQQKAKLIAQQTKKSSGGDYWATLLTRADHRFLRALENSVSEGRTPYTEAFRLTNTNLSTFEPMMQRVRGELA